MDIKKSQHFNFTHETIPFLWHKQYKEFLKFLDKDGIKFLKFWWKHLEENMGIKILSSAEGMGFQVKKSYTIKDKPVDYVLLTLPEPENIGEVYYMALAKFPDNQNFIARFFLMRLPITRVLALQLESRDENGILITGLYELTPRARNVRIKDGCDPKISEFNKFALAELKLKG